MHALYVHIKCFRGFHRLVAMRSPAINITFVEALAPQRILLFGESNDL